MSRSHRWHRPSASCGRTAWSWSMSTTTERCRRGVRFLGMALLVLAVWFSVVAVSSKDKEPTRTVAVFAPPASALSALVHANARLVDAGAGYILVQGEHTGFVRQLYAG